MIHALRGPVIVIGAGGFIGANLFKQLLHVRKDVYAVVRQNPTWRLNDVLSEHVVEVDITDSAAVRNLLSTIAPQTVFNCTAYGAYSFENNATLIQRTNYSAIVDFVEQLSQRPFAAFVHAGSSSEYGTNCSAPLENDELQPNSHYALSKVATSNYLQYCGKFRQLPVVNLRLYSVYGPLEDTARGTTADGQGFRRRRLNKKIGGGRQRKGDQQHRRRGRTTAQAKRFCKNPHHHRKPDSLHHQVTLNGPAPQNNRNRPRGLRKSG